MRIFRKNRVSTRRRSTLRRDFLKVERLEYRLALTASPLAMNDFYHDAINQPLDIGGPGILANDASSSGSPLSAGLFSGPANGTLSLNADGSFHYVPNSDFSGTDSFMYVANDGAADSQLAAVTINVSTDDNPPAAANDAYATNEDAPLAVDAAGGLLANDSDADGDNLSLTLTSQPMHGTVAVNPDGSFNYTPAANYNGLDGFSYLVSDGSKTSDVASATITVNPVNDIATAVNDEYTTAEDTPLTIGAPGVLGNDTDVDGDALTAKLVNPPLHGTVTLGPDGSLVYTPSANFNGVDGFSYVANDGQADSDAAGVTVNVTPVNDPPASTADAYSTDEDTPLTVDAANGVLANDSDPEGDSVTATLVTGPANGTLTLNPDGSFNYTPNSNYNGSDSFTYTAGDGSLSGPETTVSLTVNPVNDPPTATADDYHTLEDTPLTMDAAHGVLANDSDPDGDPLTATLVSGPANGTLTLNADGSFNYAPNSNFNGSDSFVYQASDGTLTSDPTTVTIGICPVNDAPTSAGDAYSLDQGTTLTVDATLGVLANDSDVDGDTLSAGVVSGPANGSLTLNNDGSFSYTPSASFSGTDSFVYAASDGSLQSNSTVTLTVNPVAQAPVAAIDNYSTGEDVPLSITADMGVLANDVNPDGRDMTAQVVTGPAHGTLSLNPDGSFNYAPAANFNGADSFTYKAIGSSGQEMMSSANIVVEPLNDAPVAANDEFTIDPANPPASPNNVIANDTDIDGDTLTASLVAGPAHGTLSLNPDGIFNYVPQANYSGDDSFRYQAFDGKANSNVATVTLHDIAGTSQAPAPAPAPTPTPAPPPENQRPIAGNDDFSTAQDTALDVPAGSGLLTNDSDPEGSPLTAALFSGPLHGTASVAADGSLHYTPTSGYSGMDALLYRVSDGQLWSPLAAVTIHVTPAVTSPDPAPVPAPAPTPTPTPTPNPALCQTHHHCCDDASGLASTMSSIEHHWAKAVDSVFGHHRGWHA